MPSDGAPNEANLVGLALAGANALVLSLAVVPEPWAAPVGLLAAVPLAAPYAVLLVNRYLGEGGYLGQ